MIGSRIVVVKYDPTDPRLGRHVEHDERSKNFAFMAKAATPKRVNTYWSSAIPPLNQGDVGSCTGNAMAQWLNTDYATSIRMSMRAGHQLREEDALNIYTRATKLDNIPGFYPEEDTGSTGNAAAKAARGMKLLVGYSWLFSFTSVQAAIEKTPLMVGTLWTNTMFNPKNGLVKVGSMADSNIAGGHEYLMVGISWTDKVFIFRNSWGDSEVWEGCKPGGYFTMSFSDFRKLQEADGDVTVPRWF